MGQFVASAVHHYGPEVRNFVYVLVLILAVYGAGHVARSPSLGQSQNLGITIGTVCVILAVLIALVATVTTL